MLRKGLIIAVAVLFLLGAMVGCAAELEQPTEETSVDLALTDGVAVELEPAAKEANTFTIEGWVTVDAYHYDEATGTYIPFYHHESSNIVVDIGLDWIEDQLGDTPDTVSAQWISLSSNTGGVGDAAGWSQIPDEIVDTFGLDRALGVYGDVGTGSWTIIKTFTVDAGHSYTAVQLTGLQYAASGSGNLFAANTFTPVDLGEGDTLTITWQLSVSGA